MAAAGVAISDVPVWRRAGVIQRFTARRVLRGALLFGVFAVVESLAQGIGIVAAYPDAAARATVIDTLATNPALGIFYGDPHAGISSPAGYMVYRTLIILSLIGAVWAILFITGMLRGQEENGRWELLLTGGASARWATADTLIGTGIGLGIAYVLMSLLLMAGGHSHRFQLPAGGCLFYALALIAAPALFVAVGAVASQLAATRRRAVLYAVGVLIVVAALRAVGNTVGAVAWLKNITPFGWIDALHPFVTPQPLWLLPLAVLTAACVAIALVLAGARDMGTSLIADTDTAKPKLRLVRGQLGFTVRLTRSVLLGWLAASVGLSALVAAIDKTVVQSLTGSGRLGHAISTLTGNPTATLEKAYLSAGGWFMVLLLLIMMTTMLSSLRDEEASGRLDSFVAGTVSRAHWLSARLAIMVAGAVVITMSTNFVVWAIAALQGIHVSLSTLVFGGLNILGPVAFLLGFGVLLFGLWPRLAALAMYLAIGWSLTIDILVSLIKLNKVLTDASLLHYIALVPAATPKWDEFAALVLSGIVLGAAGMLAFRRRDLQAE